MMAGTRKSLFILGLLFLNLTTAFGQTDSATVNKKRMKTVVMGGGAAYAGTMIALSKAWYSGFDRQRFTFFNDSREWMQVDKVGHVYSAFQLTSISSSAFRWAGMPSGKADRIGALVSLTMMTSIEVFDGFSAGYGASTADVISNVLGTTLYLGQTSLWKEVRIQPKFSFHQTHYAPLRPDILGQNLPEELLKDYNGQTYWLSFDMDKFVSFPKWINLAVGYGAHDMVYAMESSNLSDGYNPYRQVYLGLDVDLTSIPTRSKALKTLLYFVNMIKLPAPALEFTKSKTKFHAFYF